MQSDLVHFLCLENERVSAEIKEEAPENHWEDGEFKRIFISIFLFYSELEASFSSISVPDDTQQHFDCIGACPT